MGNAQGSYYFLGVGINWTDLPMPAEVIPTVHQPTKACKK